MPMQGSGARFPPYPSRSNVPEVSMKVRRATPLVVAVLGWVAAVGCGNNTNSSLAPFEPELNNAPGTFQLQATGVDNVTAVESYNWSNSGQSANVNQSGSLTSGTATLTVLDHSGSPVYSGNLGVSGVDQTSTGEVGTWTIRLELTEFSGDLNFRLETP
jgi:hypothetical protein